MYQNFLSPPNLCDLLAMVCELKSIVGKHSKYVNFNLNQFQLFFCYVTPHKLVNIFQIWNFSAFFTVLLTHLIVLTLCVVHHTLFWICCVVDCIVWFFLNGARLKRMLTARYSFSQLYFVHERFFALTSHLLFVHWQSSILNWTVHSQKWQSHENFVFWLIGSRYCQQNLK